MTQETKTLHIEMTKGNDRKITIPSDWTITFGPVAIGARNLGESPNVLRLYADAGKKHLKAVFRGVAAFHEEGIEIAEKVVRTKKRTFKRGEKNGEQTYAAEVRQTSWRNPFADDDDEGSEFDLDEDALQLPAVKSGEEPW